MALSIPDVWHINGVLTNDGQPYYQVAKIRAYDSYNGNKYYLGETGVSSNGSFTITYSRSMFQTVDSSRSAPQVIIQVYSYQEQVIWESNVLTDMTSEYTYNIDLDGQSQPENWTLSGTIKNSDQSVVLSGTVKIYDIYNTTEYLLGASLINSTGQYQFVYTESQFQHDITKRLNPDLKIRIYDTQDKLIGIGSVPYPPSNNQTFDLVLTSTEVEHTISGILVNVGGYPVSGIDVIIKSILFIGGKFQETELGRTSSNSKGEYSIEYHPEIIPGLTDPSKATVVVEVCKVVNGITEVISKSGAISNPGISVKTDLTVDVVSNSDLSVLTDTLDSLEENGFTEEILREISSDKNKIQYAAALTGKSEAEIEKIAYSMDLIDNLKEKIALPDIPALVDYSIIYALVKTGNVNSYQDLYRIDSDRLHTVLVSAITQSIIPPETQDNLQDIISEWRKIHTEILSSHPDKTNAGRIFMKASLPTGTDSV